MSYLEGRKNVFSLISGCIINHVKKKYAINNQIKQSLISTSDTTPNVFLGIPKNLVSTSLLTANCGNSTNNLKCLDCMKTYGITDTMLSGNNYITNINAINNVRNNECFGMCSCNFSNISLDSNLIFTTGSSINGTDLNTSEIADDVKQSMQSYNKSEASGKTYNWLYAILGVPGLIYAATNPTYSKAIDETVKSAVSNMSMLYANTINQLISSSSEITITGTGIKIHNISISSIENAIMLSTQTNCGQNNTCVSTNINNVTNTLMQSLQDSVTTQFQSMFTYAFKQNQTLIIYAVIFVVGTLFLYFYLLFKKAAHKIS